MADIERLLAELNEFRNYSSPEIELRKLERWMIRELGVERVYGGRGSKVVYFHKALKISNNEGHFTVHLIHGRKKEMIRKINFRNYTYEPLKIIIESLK